MAAADDLLGYTGPMPCDWSRRGVVTDAKGRRWDLRVEGVAGTDAEACWGWAVGNLFAVRPMPARTSPPPGLKCTWRVRTQTLGAGD